MMRTRRNLAGRRFDSILWILLVLCLLASGPRTATAQTATVVLTGEAAPDGNGTFSDFEVPTLNSSGQIAFVAQFTGTASPSTDANGIFAPRDSSALGLSHPGLDSAGRASFGGTLTGTSGGQYVDDNGVFRSDGSMVTRMLRSGQILPGTTEIIETVNPGNSSNPNGQTAASVSLF